MKQWWTMLRLKFGDQATTLLDESVGSIQPGDRLIIRNLEGDQELEMVVQSIDSATQISIRPPGFISWLRSVPRGTLLLRTILLLLIAGILWALWGVIS